MKVCSYDTMKFNIDLDLVPIENSWTDGPILYVCITNTDISTNPRVKSSFSQTHKVGNVGIIVNCVFPYICSFLPLFALNDVGKM